MNLDEIRVDIDKIDRDIVELIKKRMNLSLSVAEYKINNGKKVFDAEREKAILKEKEFKPAAAPYKAPAQVVSTQQKPQQQKVQKLNLKKLKKH